MIVVRVSMMSVVRGPRKQEHAEESWEAGYSERKNGVGSAGF